MGEVATGNDRGALLRARDIVKSFGPSREHLTQVLAGISLDLRKGEILSIVGPNGCGKSTLLLCLAGLVQADGGSVEIEGEPVVPGRAGLVFQSYRESLLPWRKAWSNIAFALGDRDSAGGGLKERVTEFTLSMGLDLPLDKYPYQLSGGQQQMISVLRSLIVAPPVLLLDEPFAALDYRTRLRLHDRVQEVFDKLGQAAIFVSHEIDEAILLADRVLVLSSRPAQVVEEVHVTLPRPRSHDLVVDEQFLAIKRQVFAAFGTDSEAIA